MKVSYLVRKFFSMLIFVIVVQYGLVFALLISMFIPDLLYLYSTAALNSIHFKIFILKIYFRSISSDSLVILNIFGSALSML